MSLAGRQLSSRKVLSHGFGKVACVRQARPASHRLRSGTSYVARNCTDARLAQDNTSGTAPSQRHEREAILLQRYKAHNAAITATLVREDAGALLSANYSSLCLEETNRCDDVRCSTQATPRRL